MATHLTLVKPGDVVIGVSETPQPSLGGARRQSCRRRFIDTAWVAAFRDAIATEKPVARRTDPARGHLRSDAGRCDPTRSCASRTTRARWSMSTMPAARASARPLSISRGCWNSGSISAQPVSTNTAPIGPRFGLLAGRRNWSAASAPRGSSSAWRPARRLYPAVVRTLEQYDPARVRALIDEDEGDRRRIAAAARQPVARDTDNRADRRRRHPRCRDGARRRHRSADRAL